MGLRLVRGLAQEHGRAIEEAVGRRGPFRTIEDLWRASGVPVRALKALAAADAFGSMGIDRRRALWEVRGLRDGRLPLFEEGRSAQGSRREDVGSEPERRGELATDEHRWTQMAIQRGEGLDSEEIGGSERDVAADGRGWTRMAGQGKEPFGSEGGTAETRRARAREREVAADERGWTQMDIQRRDCPDSEEGRTEGSDGGRRSSRSTLRSDSAHSAPPAVNPPGSGSEHRFPSSAPSAPSSAASAFLRDPDDLRLPPMAEEMAVAHDYATLGLSLRAHPMSFFREALGARGVRPASDLRDERRCPHNRKVSVAGVVLMRQRPGTASGIVFMTLEDETGIANLVIRPRIYVRYRRAARHGVCLIAHGHVERQGEVVHVIVHRVEDMHDGEAPIRAKSRDFH